MKTSVSRLTIIDGKKYLPDGSRACSVGVCSRPAVVTPRRVQSYCREHATEKTRAWRRGKVGTMLTPEERELIIELRKVQPAGRHHARANLQRGTGYMKKITISAAALAAVLAFSGSGVAVAAVGAPAPFLPPAQPIHALTGRHAPFLPPAQPLPSAFTGRHAPFLPPAQPVNRRGVIRIVGIVEFPG